MTFSSNEAKSSFRKYMEILGGKICNKDCWKICNSFRVIKGKRFFGIIGYAPFVMQICNGRRWIC